MSIVGALFRALRHRAVAASAAILILTIGVAGTATASGTNVESSHAAAAQISLSSLPASVQSSYAHYKTFATLLPNPYANWTAPKGQLKFCDAESSLEGNVFREAGVAEFKKLVGELNMEGIAKSATEVTDANNSMTTMLSQLESDVSSGCNVVIVDGATPTGLCSGFKSALQHHVLVLTTTSPVLCPDVMNVSFNDYDDAYTGAKAVATALHGKGNVIVEEGIEGTDDTIASDAGVAAAFKPYPNIKVIGRINGQWAASIAKSATMEFLATHPQTVNGIIDEGQMAAPAEEALQQSGKKTVPTNDYSGECAWFGYEHANTSTATVTALEGGAPTVYETMHVALRMIEGQKPVVNTLMFQVPTVSASGMAALYKPSMTVSSSCLVNPKSGTDVPDSYFDALFKGGKKTPAMKP